MKRFENLKVEELNKHELSNLTGGYWLYAALIAIAYTEVTKIWESGGQNVIDAYNAGYEAGPSGSNN